MPHSRWNTLARKKAFKHGKWIEVDLHTVQLPDGQMIQDWPWVKTPDFINVLPVTDHGEILCFRQMKYAFERPGLAPIGGYIEIGEEPLFAAQRELLEETGYQAKLWTHLYSGWMDPNRGVARGHLFLAEGAFQVSAPNADDLEEQEALQLSRSEALPRVWPGNQGGRARPREQQAFHSDPARHQPR